MTPLFPAISAATAAVLGLLAAFLAVNVIRNRVRFNAQVGDGGHVELAQVIRAHANLTENAALVVLLLALAESSGAHRWAVTGLAAVFVLARLANAWGLSHTLGPSTARQAGAGLTILVTVLASLLLGYRLLG